MNGIEISELRNAAVQNPGAIMEPYDRIFAEAGFEGLKVFLETFGGGAVYVPTLRSVLSKCIEVEAKKERENNMPVRQIAKKYGYSVRHLRKVLDGI